MLGKQSSTFLSTITVLVDTRKVSRAKPDDDYTDAELLAEFKDNNLAYRVLLERYNDQIFYYLKKLLNNSEQDAKDALGETWSRVYSKLALFDTTRTFKNWLYRIAHNTAIDLIRKNSTRKTSTINEQNEHHFFYKHDFFKLNNDDLQKVFVLMKDEEVTLLTLYYIKDRSIDEVQAALHLTSKNLAFVKINRAIKKAKKIAATLGY